MKLNGVFGFVVDGEYVVWFDVGFLVGFDNMCCFVCDFF